MRYSPLAIAWASANAGLPLLRVHRDSRHMLRLLADRYRHAARVCILRRVRRLYEHRLRRAVAAAARLLVVGMAGELLSTTSFPGLQAVLPRPRLLVCWVVVVHRRERDSFV